MGRGQEKTGQGGTGEGKRVLLGPNCKLFGGLTQGELAVHTTKHNSLAMYEALTLINLTT